MPRFAPFPGLRYDPELVSLADVVAPPYDVIDPQERADLQARSPYNSVRIELPDATPALDPYQAAAQRLAEWQERGILRRDPEARYYGYQMTYTDPTGRQRHTVGVIGALGLEPPGHGVFPHERTTPKAKSDRLQLLQSTKVNTSPIWGLSLAKGLSVELIAPDTAHDVNSPNGAKDPDLVVDDDGVAHRAWPITDPDAIARITEAVSSAPVVIADGHHRFDTALTYQQQAGQATPVAEAGQTEGSHGVMALIVELVQDQLSVQGIHRLLSDLPADLDLVGALSAFFEVTPTDASAAILERMAHAGAMGLLTPAGAWLLEARPGTIAAAAQDLDSSRLEVALAALPPHQLTYQHGYDAAAAAVARGDAQAAVLLRPVTVEQIAATAQGGERMPPKTTFFWPKPRTGFVFRQVED
ncbi:MAG TPA: DUF1015 domain-containing protein [Acidimicrobiales bacterium]|nr:DUF1015 domain-containing protein [Acidimicrobiales bacterium]